MGVPSAETTVLIVSSMPAVLGSEHPDLHCKTCYSRRCWRIAQFETKSQTSSIRRGGVSRSGSSAKLSARRPLQRGARAERSSVHGGAPGRKDSCPPPSGREASLPQGTTCVVDAITTRRDPSSNPPEHAIESMPVFWPHDFESAETMTPLK